jgi:predicted transcriptional regulator
MDFSDSLTLTTDLFRKSELGGHTTITFDGIETRFEKITRKKQLINKICDELADSLLEKLQDNDNIEYLGFDDLRVRYKSKLEEESDSFFMNCDIWEKIDKREFK